MINNLGVVPMVLALAWIIIVLFTERNPSPGEIFIPAGILFSVGFVMVLYSFTQIYR